MKTKTMRRLKMTDIKMIGVDKTTKERLDAYIGDLMIEKMTYNEIIVWLLDIKDNIMNQKTLEDLQKDIDYEEYIRRTLK